MSDHERAPAPSVDTTASKLIETTKRQRLPDVVIDRLEEDLLMDRTATGARVNLKLIESALLYDRESAATHWRLAKIMDAMVVCRQDFNLKMLKPNKRGQMEPFALSPGTIPEGVYDIVEQKKADEKLWEVKVKPPGKTRDDEAETYKASLADFAHILDVLKINEELGDKRMRMDKLVYEYFKGECKAPINVKVANKDGAVVNFNLLDPKLNPRDDYQALNFDGYMKSIAKSDLALENIGSDEWRYESPQDGHCEKSCHAWLTNVKGQLEWIPTSGEAARQAVMEDMLKRSPAENLKGQPQEFMDMVEDSEGGPCIRTRFRNLEQRRTGLSPQEISRNTNSRTSRQMVGLTLLEEPKIVKKPLVDGGKETKVVFLCGENTDQLVIKGMHVHHDAFRERIGLPKLTDKEASDLVFTDVFAPIILKNPVDWIIQVARTYGVSTPQAVANLSSNKFDDFAIQMWCRDVKSDKDRGKVVLQTFTSLRQIVEYTYERLAAGHISQGPFNPERVPLPPVAETAPEAAAGVAETGKPVGDITKENGKRFYKVLKGVLGSEYAAYLLEYLEGQQVFPPMRDADGKRLPIGAEGAGQKKKNFEAIVKGELEKMNPDDQYKLLKDLYPDIDEDDKTGEPDGEDLRIARDKFIEALKKLDAEEREKLQGR